jgi:hypothetical protein
MRSYARRFCCEVWRWTCNLRDDELVSQKILTIWEQSLKLILKSRHIIFGSHSSIYLPLKPDISPDLRVENSDEGRNPCRPCCPEPEHRLCQCPKCPGRIPSVPLRQNLRLAVLRSVFLACIIHFEVEYLARLRLEEF